MAEEMEVIAVLPHLWIVPLTAVLFAALGLLWWFGFAKWWPGDYRRKYPHDPRLKWCGWSMVAIIWWIVAGVVAIISVFLFIPFDGKYHHFYSVEGTLTDVSRSFVEGTGDLSYQPVATIEGFDQAVVVEDSRIYSAVGSNVTLTCSFEWVPYGADRANCFIRSIG